MELTLAVETPHLHGGDGWRARRADRAVRLQQPDAKADPPTRRTSVVMISGDGMGIQQRTAIQYATYGLKERQPMDALPVSGFLDTDPARPVRQRLGGRRDRLVDRP